MAFQTEQHSLAEDKLCGIKEIAKFLGETPRRTHYMLEKKAIPSFKCAGRWYAMKSRLRAHFQQGGNGHAA